MSTAPYKIQPFLTPGRTVSLFLSHGQEQEHYRLASSDKSQPLRMK
jgi:hypothetical protein